MPLGPQGSLRLDRVAASGSSLSIDPDAGLLSLKGSLKLDAYLSAADLLEMARTHAGSGVEVVSLSVINGAIEAEVHLPMAITKLKAMIRCGLESPNGHDLNLTLIDVRVVGVNARTLAQNFLKSINPVFQTEIIGLPCRIAETRLADGAARLTLVLESR